LVGVLGTLIGITNAFRFGIIAGNRIDIMAGRAKDLSEALVPTALGLGVALVSGYC
jgi:biopolymer transport protein ExbB/TolQ